MRTQSCSQGLQQKMACHPEWVIKLLHHIVFIADNMRLLGCVGIVQADCVNLSQFCLLQIPWARGARVRRPFFRS
jgi:hypothetical protein